MNKDVQSNILGLSKDNLSFALDRKFTIPFVFEGSKNEQSRQVGNSVPVPLAYNLALSVFKSLN